MTEPHGVALVIWLLLALVCEVTFTGCAGIHLGTLKDESLFLVRRFKLRALQFSEAIGSLSLTY